MVADSGMNKVSHQWRHPQGPPPDASYSYTSCSPVGAGHMAQPGTDQHESRIALRKTAHHTGMAADLPVQSFNDIVDTDTSPVFSGKIAVGQCFFNAVLHLPGDFFQLQGTQFFYHGSGFLTDSFLTLPGVDCFEHLGYHLHFRAKRHREHIAVKVDRTPLVFGPGEHFLFMSEVNSP